MNRDGKWGGTGRAKPFNRATYLPSPGLGLGFGLGLASGKRWVGTWPVTRLDLQQNRLHSIPQSGAACWTVTRQGEATGG